MALFDLGERLVACRNPVPIAPVMTCSRPGDFGPAHAAAGRPWLAVYQLPA
jgi:hypothetical protein